MIRRRALIYPVASDIRIQHDQPKAVRRGVAALHILPHDRY